MSIHNLIYLFISSFITLFPVINPVGSGFIVNGFLGELDAEQRKSVIRRIVINCLLVGIGSLVVGHFVLLLFGLAIPVIQVGGGIIICKTGWEFLSDAGTTNDYQDKQKTISKVSIDDIEKKLFYPIAFPISLGPGSISVIFTLMATASEKGSVLHTGINYAIISLVIVVMMLILKLFLVAGPRIMQKLGKTGNIVINKLIAFITFCIGIQIIFTGIGKIFHIDIL